MLTEHSIDRGTAGRGGLRVAFLTSIFPNPENPTLGTFHEQIARQLTERCELTVVSPLPWFPRVPAVAGLEPWLHYARIPRQWSVHGIPVFSPKYAMVPRVSESIRPMLMFPGLLRLIRRLHRRRPFDVIAGLWLYPDGVAAACVSRWLNIPLVLTGLGCDVNVCLDEPIQARQIRWAAGHARSVIVVSRDLKDRLCAAGIPAAKIEVIMNGVDLDRFQPADRDACARELGLAVDRPRCLYVGRLSHEKGVCHLLSAMAHLRRRRSHAMLYVVGDGPLRSECEELAVRLELGESVEFVGAKDHAEIATWLGACNLLCLPSLREGCPNVVLEALASGRPVVASRVGGVPDVVNASNGLLVDAADSMQLAEALESALAATWDPDALRLSSGRQSWGGVADRYQRVFEAAAAGADPRPSRAASARVRAM